MAIGDRSAFRGHVKGAVGAHGRYRTQVYFRSAGSRETCLGDGALEANVEG